MMTVIVLPFPPTTNHLFANFTRKGKQLRVQTNAYKAWQLEAGMELMRQRPVPSFDAPVELTLKLGRPDRRRRDLANYEKAVSDLLVEHKILTDDSLIHKLTMLWANDVHGVQVEIEPYSGVIEAGMVA